MASREIPARHFHLCVLFIQIVAKEIVIYSSEACVGIDVFVWLYSDCGE